MSSESGATDGGNALFGPEPRERMTRTHLALWAVVIFATTADVILTMAGLAGGLEEGNVVVREMVAAFGVAGLWIVKFLAMCWLVAGWAYLSDRNASVFLALFAVVTLAVVVHNALTILAF